MPFVCLPRLSLTLGLAVCAACASPVPSLVAAGRFPEACHEASFGADGKESLAVLFAKPKLRIAVRQIDPFDAYDAIGAIEEGNAYHGPSEAPRPVLELRVTLDGANAPMRVYIANIDGVGPVNDEESRTLLFGYDAPQPIFSSSPAPSRGGLGGLVCRTQPGLPGCGSGETDGTPPRAYLAERAFRERADAYLGRFLQTQVAPGETATARAQFGEGTDKATVMGIRIDYLLPAHQNVDDPTDEMTFCEVSLSLHVSLANVEGIGAKLERTFGAEGRYLSELPTQPAAADHIGVTKSVRFGPWFPGM